MNKFTLMIGLPGSGKSTIAQKYGGIVLSSDAIREEVLGNVADQSKNELVFKVAHKRIHENLASCKDVVFDATNLKKNQRIALLRELKKYNCQKVAVWVATPVEECKRRNAKRDRHVPEKVIDRMYKSFCPPHYAEGFDEIIIEYAKDVDGREDWRCLKKEELKDNMNIPQDNPHHTLSLDKHCSKALEQLSIDIKMSTNPYGLTWSEFCTLLIATRYHDIGKVSTKTFVNAKGETTNVAHYYNHENTGAYDVVFMFEDDKLITKMIVDVANLIYYHMKPYVSWRDSERSRQKDIDIMGENFINLVDILHKADVNAH